MHIAEKNLLEAFFNCVKSTPVYRQLKMFVGITSQGKTHNVIKHWIPCFIKETDITFIVFTAPQHSQMSPKEMEEACNELNIAYVYNDIREANIQHSRGKPVLLSTTNSTFVSEKTAELLEDYIKRKNVKVAVIIDECHSWSASDWSNYKDVTGHASTEDKYKASMPYALEKWAEYTHHTYGLSATPTSEQNGTLEPKGNLSFKIVNSRLSKKDTIDISAWIDLDNCELYDPAEDQNHVVERSLRRFIQNYNDRISHATAYKMPREEIVRPIVMIKASQKRSTKGLSAVKALDATLRVFKKHFNHLNHKPTVAIMTSDPKQSGFYSVDGGIGRVQRKTEAEIIAALKDDDHTVMAVIVVEKGQQGMSINNISHIIDLRLTETKDSLGNPIARQKTQMLGRAHRCSIHKSIPWGGLKNFVTNASHADIKMLFLTNTYSYVGPSNSTTQAALEEAQKDTSSKEEAEKWIAGLRNSKIDENFLGKLSPSKFDPSANKLPEINAYIIADNKVEDKDIKGVSFNEPVLSDAERRTEKVIKKAVFFAS